MRNLPRAGALIGVVTLLVAGCSTTTVGTGAPAGPVSASPSGPTGFPSTSAGSTSAPTTRASGSPTASGTAARLAAIVVQPSDLPSGWDSAPYVADPADDTDHATLVQCVGGRDATPNRVAQVHSPDYEMRDAQVSSQASLYKSADDLNAEIAIWTSSKIATCYKQLALREVSSSLPAGATVSSSAISFIGGPNGGPSNLVATGTGKFTLTLGGQSIDLYLMAAFIKGPLIEAEVDFFSPGQPVPTTLFSSLTKAVAARAAG